MNETFSAIVTRKLGRVPTAFDKQEMQVQIALDRKGDDMAATFLADTEEGMMPKTLSEVEDSADRYIEDVLSTEIYDSMTSVFMNGKVKRTSSRNEKFTVDVPKVTGLRLKTGQGISAPNLVRVLNAVLYSYVQKLMGTRSGSNNPYFKNASGRFAHTVKVLGITAPGPATSARETSVYFAYLVQPYSLFEHSKKFASRYGSPTMLGKEAIRAAIKDTLHKDSINSLQLSGLSTYINKAYT